jgi:putative DNA primase/helicase
MLADAPLWLQDWTRNRHVKSDTTNDLKTKLGEPPPYLTTETSRLQSDINTRLGQALRTPWSPQEEAHLRSALDSISAVQRDDWLRIGMAIHGAGWGARGFEIWSEWSRSAPEKYNDADQARTWESFDRPSRDGRCVTLATVFFMATERGWVGRDLSVHIIQDDPSSAGGNSAAPNNRDSANSILSDEENEIRRLAKLTLIDYERARKDAVERLNFRAQTLDRLVEARRAKPDDDSKQGHALRLPEPEPWPDPINGAGLLSALAINIRQHVVMSDKAADMAALWVIHTYLLDCFGISPRLAITSPEKGCGKTTALDVLSPLVFRPLSTSNASTAAIFRVVELQQPTLLIDEADTFLFENDELRGILNSGHRHGGTTLRTVGEDFEPRLFSTYSACAIALIGKLPATLADRSVPIELRRRKPDEAIKPFRYDRTDHLNLLARKAARWARDNADRVRGTDPDMPAGVFNRAADNWRPLLAIADAAGGEWPGRARRSVQCLGAGASGDDQSVRVLLLSDVRVIFAERGLDRLPSADLVWALNSVEGRPWAEWNRSKGLTPNGLARQLAHFGIAPSTIRTSTGTPKGYQLAQFDDAFARYLPSGEF